MEERKYLSLQEIQQEELRLLNHLADFCESHNLTFSLDAGTLIGAVRHKGFIPWDDDIDVCMSRPDCDTLITLAKEIETDTIRLQGFYGVPLDYSSQLRLVSKRVMLEDKHVFDHGDNNLWIDIFPIDGYPESKEEGITLCKKTSFYRRLMAAGSMKWSALSNKIISLGVAILRPILRSTPFRTYCAKKMNTLQRSIPYASTSAVGGLCHVSKGEDRMDYLSFEKTIPVKFEGRTYRAMSCYDQHLRNWYGDYMQLPPEEKRIPIHTFDAWWMDSPAS